MPSRPIAQPTRRAASRWRSPLPAEDPQKTQTWNGPGMSRCPGEGGSSSRNGLKDAMMKCVGPRRNATGRSCPSAHRSRLVSEANFKTVARVGDIPEGQGQLVELDGIYIALFHCGGLYYAIDDACPHQGAPLSDGIVFDQERSVTCTWHGWR